MMSPDHSLRAPIAILMFSCSVESGMDWILEKKSDIENDIMKIQTIAMNEVS